MPVFESGHWPRSPVGTGSRGGIRPRLIFKLNGDPCPDSEPEAAGGVVSLLRRALSVVPVLSTHQMTTIILVGPIRRSQICVIMIILLVSGGPQLSCWMRGAIPHGTERTPGLASAGSGVQ
jgi:hypothetical protein